MLFRFCWAGDWDTHYLYSGFVISSFWAIESLYADYVLSFPLKAFKRFLKSLKLLVHVVVSDGDMIVKKWFHKTILVLKLS